MRLGTRTLMQTMLAGGLILAIPAIVLAGSKNAERTLQNPGAASARVGSTVAGGSVAIVGHSVQTAGGAVSMVGMASAAVGGEIVQTGKDMLRFGKSPLPLGQIDPARTADPAPRLN